MHACRFFPDGTFLYRTSPSTVNKVAKTMRHKDHQPNKEKDFRNPLFQGRYVLKVRRGGRGGNLPLRYALCAWVRAPRCVVRHAAAQAKQRGAPALWRTARMRPHTAVPSSACPPACLGPPSPSSSPCRSPGLQSSPPPPPPRAPFPPQGTHVYAVVVYPNSRSTEIRTRLGLRSTRRGAHDRLDIHKIMSYDRADGTSTSMLEGACVRARVRVAPLQSTACLCMSLAAASAAKQCRMRCLGCERASCFVLFGFGGGWGGGREGRAYRRAPCALRPCAPCM